MKNILVTGGAGFIGSNFLIQRVLKDTHLHYVNFDALTYAGNLENLSAIEKKSNYTFIKGNILSPETIHKALRDFSIDTIIHFAAESHVDRSILDPMAFLNTNVSGTFHLLQQALGYWKEKNILESARFLHVSTDEVYGSLGATGYFSETTQYQPNSPYSASKAGSDHLVRSYHHTFGMNTLITNCSNNYGPFQFPEKLIPLMIHNILNKKPLPVYGDGKNIRDWLYVEDHCNALYKVLTEATAGSHYNIGGHNEWTNIDIVHLLCDTVDKKVGNPPGTSRSLIKYVTDRLGHDRRYAIDASKIEKELGWKPMETFETGIDKTIDWYLANSSWLKNVTSGDYQSYYQNMYGSK